MIGVFSFVEWGAMIFFFFSRNLVVCALGHSCETFCFSLQMYVQRYI